MPRRNMQGRSAGGAHTLSARFRTISLRHHSRERGRQIGEMLGHMQLHSVLANGAPDLRAATEDFNEKGNTHIPNSVSSKEASVVLMFGIISKRDNVSQIATGRKRPKNETLNSHASREKTVACAEKRFWRHRGPCNIYELNMFLHAHRNTVPHRWDDADDNNAAKADHRALQGSVKKSHGEEATGKNKHQRSLQGSIDMSAGEKGGKHLPTKTTRHWSYG